MAFIRCCFIIAVLFFCTINTKAQTVYYPEGSSQMLKATAADVAMLLQKAITGSKFTAQEYIDMPTTGIILVYDSTITDNQFCKVESDGINFIKFTAAGDNGLNFGVYQYLQQCGFRFYQPGTIWEIIPQLISPFKKISTNFSCNLKYNTFAISGGHNCWAMDNNTNYGWDIYFGDNGHNWALYQRRNGMAGMYRFSGHRGDLMTGSYLSALQTNPCYVACYNGSRVANASSVPDINNTAAMQLWSTTIAGQYGHFKNIIYANTGLYTNYYRNFNYNYGNIGIEVPDGSQWGNSKDSSSCSSVNYPGESDQEFTLANFTANNLSTVYPGKRFQLYAYSNHANPPSSNISINNNIDVQVVSTAFQSESSPKGLLNRWYNRYHNISEYHYLNIPQWGGETPMFYLDDLKSTLQRSKDKNNQGIFWEASPAKFASLPFLLAANNNLKDNVAVDSTLQNFCNDMFAGASQTIYKLLQLWSDDKSISTGDFIQDNKYKIPLYLQLLNDAVTQTQNAVPIVKERMLELKAYIHYMVLYYDWLYDQRNNADKAPKAATVCVYLAKINKMQLVNSYFIISDIASRYAATDTFNKQFNATNGSAYQGGNLPLITANEIENNFQQDLSLQSNLVQQYQLQTASFIKDEFSVGNISPLKTISVSIGYTNGYEYPNRSEFNIIAPFAGNFGIQFTPHFNMPGKGYINFTVESTDKALQIIKDFSIDNNSAAGTINISLPAAGNYKLSVVSKFQSAVDLIITTNGNYFFKNGPFLGNATENYRNNLLSFPGYFYVPSGISKIYFSVNNSNPGGTGYASAEAIGKSFLIKDNGGNIVQPKLVSTVDSSLFYLDVSTANSGSFWQVYKMEGYRLCFANLSNLMWFAQRNSCVNADFTIAAVNVKGNCLTRLTSTSTNTLNLKWQIYDMGRSVSYDNTRIVDLPDYTSPNAIVTLTNSNNCTLTKRLVDDKSYLMQKEACASGAALPPIINGCLTPVLYPNPSNGIFKCLQNGMVTIADEIILNNSQGMRVADFKNVMQFNISNTASGVYWYRMLINGVQYTGKLIKL